MPRVLCVSCRHACVPFKEPLQVPNHITLSACRYINWHCSFGPTGWNCSLCGAFCPYKTLKNRRSAEAGRSVLLLQLQCHVDMPTGMWSCTYPIEQAVPCSGCPAVRGWQ